MHHLIDINLFLGNNINIGIRNTVEINLLTEI